VHINIGVVWVLVALAVVVPVAVFVAPDSAFEVFDNTPIKALMTVLVFVVLAVGAILVRVITAELSAMQVSLRAWQASLALATATLSHPLVPINQIASDRLGVRFTLSESPRPTDTTIAVAFLILFVFTGYYSFVRWLARESGPF
jgi:nitric oxide reductase large subunit